jgi:hypothetical protein
MIFLRNIDPWFVLEMFYAEDRRGSDPRRSDTQFVQQLDERHEQGDDDEADDQTEDDHHHRFEQTDQAFDEDGDFFVVDVGDLIEHGVEGTGFLADVDHVDDHVVDDPGFLEGHGHRFPFADGGRRFWSKRERRPFPAVSRR